MTKEWILSAITIGHLIGVALIPITMYLSEGKKTTKEEKVESGYHKRIIFVPAITLLTGALIISFISYLLA